MEREVLLSDIKHILSMVTLREDEKIPVDTPLSMFGIDSLDMTEIKSELYIYCGIDSIEINSDKTLNEIVDIIDQYYKNGKKNC